MGYAATHPGWDGVGPTVRELAAQTGRRIILTTPDRQPVAASAAVGEPLPQRPSAIVDPLRADPVLGPDARTGQIDPRAVGPYLLPTAERAEARARAEKALACVRKIGLTGELRQTPSGRTAVAVTGPDPTGLVALDCPLRPASEPMPTERTALNQLEALVSDCLRRQGAAPVQLTVDFTWYADGVAADGRTSQQVQACIDAGRREQLRPYVAPAALLFVTSSTSGEPAAFDLSARSTVRIVGVTALVLALAVTVTVLVGTRLVRPLRALTVAAQHPADRQVRVPVTGKDEIAHLAVAFNDLAERRQRAEAQRKAMVSDVAHELRTPLTNIRNWLEAAQDGLAPVDPQLLALLLEEAVLLQHVIDDLRDLAAADAGNLRLHPEPLYVNDVVDQVAEAHGGAAEAAGVRLVVRADAQQRIVADPVRLRQLLGNLVANAVRHTPASGTVTLTSRRDGEQIVIEVADSGTGIDPADLPHVFDRFWRADKSRNRHTGGSGLGLAIAQKLTHAHGGDITVTSAPGTGTTCTVRPPHRRTAAHMRRCGVLVSPV